jgi:hypothetical protein
MTATNRESSKRLNARSCAAVAASVAIPWFQDVFFVCQPISISETPSSSSGLIPQ